MSASARLRILLRAARHRRLAIVLALWLPMLCAALVIGWRLAVLPVSASLLAGTAVLVASAAVAARVARGLDEIWLSRQLDHLRPELEDSSALVLAERSGLSGLAPLQRARIDARLAAMPLPDLRPPWPVRGLALSWLSAAALIAASLLAQEILKPPTTAADAKPAGTAAVSVFTTIPEIRLDVTPPAYTRLPPRSEPALETRVPEGATVAWTLTLQPAPDAVTLRFHDGQALALARHGQAWRGRRVVSASTLYRLEVDGGPALVPADDRLYRLDVVPDQPPELRVFAPERTLSLVEPGQRDWLLEFEASDDHGLATARLSITLAHGTGENISFSETVRTLTGQGDHTRKRYRHRIALADTGFEPGDDLVLRLSVADNREPEPRTSRHPSLILRWPLARSGQTSALEGIVRDAMPAYFRSQRQIIIDSEALLAERGGLTPERFVDRSDAIGVDQRILRLRYGQFLGEETEGGDQPVASAHDDHADEDEPAPEPGHSQDDGHDHGASQDSRPDRFGDAGDVIAEYGHMHDYAEAATLFDPQTRALLKSALDQMWQSELHLRSGRPDTALPFQYRALDFIKQVQQASRIYLARVGLELPPVDFSRRLGGDLAGVGQRRDALAAADVGRAWLVESWQALEQGGAVDLDRLTQWLRDEPEQIDDPLALLAAIDSLRRDPGCNDCAQRLMRLLWPLLPAPAATVEARPAPGTRGQRYLEALRERSGPDETSP